jgi:hypothetical protein
MSVEDRLRGLGEVEWDVTLESTLRDVTNISSFRRRRKHVVVLGATAAIIAAALIAPRTSRIFATPEIVSRPAGVQMKTHDHQASERAGKGVTNPAEPAGTTAAGASHTRSTSTGAAGDPAGQQQAGTSSSPSSAKGQPQADPQKTPGAISASHPLFTRRDRSAWSVPAPQPGGVAVIYEWQPSQPRSDEHYLKVILRASDSVGSGGVKAELWQTDAGGQARKLATICGESDLVPVVPLRDVEVRIFNGGCDGLTYYSGGQADLEYFK